MTDGRIVTGANPASAEVTAQATVKMQPVRVDQKSAGPRPHQVETMIQKMPPIALVGLAGVCSA